MNTKGLETYSGLEQHEESEQRAEQNKTEDPSPHILSERVGKYLSNCYGLNICVSSKFICRTLIL